MEPAPRQPTPAPSTGRAWMVSAGLAAGALLPVILLSVFAYRLAAGRMYQLVDRNNATAAGMTAELIRSDLARLSDMSAALAAQPGIVDAARRHDADGVRQRLKATYDATGFDAAAGGRIRRIDRMFLTDPAGLEWSDYPHAPESIGKYFSDRDWYKGVSRDWQPYLSEVYQRNAEPRILIVAMTAPVRDTDGKVIGILVFQMPLAYLSEVMKSVHVGSAGYVYVVDRRGAVAAHPILGDLATRRYPEPAASPPVARALNGQGGAATYTDPISGVPMVAAFRPIHIPNGTWAAVAQQPLEDVQAPIRRLRANIATAGSLMAVVLTVLVATLRHAALRDRRLSRQLEITAAAEHAARIQAQAANETLRQTQGQLVQSEKLAALGQLVAGVAHEINNPLAFVLNNVAVLQRDVIALLALLKLYQSGDKTLKTHEPELLRQIAELAEQIDLDCTLNELSEAPARTREGLMRIQQIVKDLRDFARQNAIGEVQPDADVNGGVESTVNIARGMARKRQVELACDLGHIPPIHCSPGRINQVVLNLVSNAVDASPPGEKVLVRTRATDGWMTIEVVDHGSGIDPAIRGRIFDPFFTTKPQGQGTGLGLSISHGIVSDHGGRIEVESTVGQGTTFRVLLPVNGGTAQRPTDVAAAR